MKYFKDLLGKNGLLESPIKVNSSILKKGRLFVSSKLKEKRVIQTIIWLGNFQSIWSDNFFHWNT